ncbi:MAG: NAD(P)/FAD-dependent oxidoreductase [Betaproteobacteria bacterium]|nr:NAD(P)/FAD-dependent oxidoreductase [Betaproteobacteria bacterium]MDH4323125.1 NAD(P)/FAD-dependent oxidoreductase [Betaproteobacteria bacterium]
MSHIALVLGAGLGGTVAAQTLRRLLPRGERVVLVEREERHVFPPSLLWLMVGERSAEAISRPVAHAVRAGIELTRGKVTALDPAARTVCVGDQTLRGDAIVLALGAEYAPQAIPGLDEAGLCIYTLAGATAIREALERFERGRLAVLTATPAYKCPAAPYEAALLVDDFLRKRGRRDKVTMEFYAAEPGPMMVAGATVSAGVRGMIEAQGIGYHPEHQVKAVDPRARRLEFANGASADFDLLLYVPPHRAPEAVRDAGLTNESGWIPVDRHTLATKHPGVYAIGDITMIPLKMGRPLPKAGVFAHGQAEVVAHNIAHDWTGKREPRRFEGEGMCFIESGAGRAGMGRGNFYAEPLPDVRLHQPGLLWHGAKVLYEKYWLFTKF